MKFSVFQLSRRGGRAVNEDRMGYCYTQEAALFVLADGMGGHAVGEVAAQLALQSIAAQFQQEALPTLNDVSDFLSRAVLTTHRHIQHYAKRKRMSDGPHTTVVVAIIQDGAATWAHCGDSRLYWVRDGQLLARTRDHSYLEMEHRAARPIRLAHKLRNRNVLFTCLGAQTQPIIDVSGPHTLRSGDRLLLCSDGLWGVIKESALLHGLSGQPVHTAIPALVESALRSAGKTSDNVTALGLEWEMPEAVHSPCDVRSESICVLFASSILPSQNLDTLEDSLDEEEIARNITEINTAICRSAPSKT
ncbi:MAG: PP2C family protein-serine/threonine phosphatase [Comamonas sp.]